eukprot:GDKI01041788.1.p2 GENE.GDKI01041788.1~~GDKI01041788.1.p2  ORF type:complete len:148 (-),score=60.86 GDKI01041788.1:158-574(-)
MSFKRFVEAGRVAMISFGPDYGKLCTIVDVVDQNKALVEGPHDLTGVARHMIPFKRLALTDIKVKVPRNARSSTVKKAWKTEEVEKKWAESAWGKKRIAKATKAAMTDFDRFSLMVVKKKKSVLLQKKLKELKAKAKK